MFRSYSPASVRVCLAAAALVCALPASTVHALISLDGSVGAAGALTGPDFAVSDTQGQVVGTTLYLSFDVLDVAANETLTITAPDGVLDIVMRVTGGAATTIAGAITVTHGDTMPNLWLLQPAGLSFEATATVTVPAGLALSTGDYIRASSGDRFAVPPIASEVLADTAPLHLGFLGTDHGTFSAVDVAFDVPGALTLASGDIDVDGGELRGADVSVIGASLGEFALDTRGISMGSAGAVILTGTAVRAGRDGEVIVSPEGCGNGYREGDEACDTGDDRSDSVADACRMDCSTPICGDSVVDTGEECDRGMSNSDTEVDGCRSDCRNAYCGDDILDSGEICDDGADNSIEEDACQPNCIFVVCGDGIVSAVEECDEGAANSDTTPDACRADCTDARCGDGVVDMGEECDSGTTNSDNAPDTCRTTCQAPICGDGILDTDEVCDDGVFNNDTRPEACVTDCSGRSGDLILVGGACGARPRHGDAPPIAALLALLGLGIALGHRRRPR